MRPTSSLIGRWIHRPGMRSWHQVESEVTDRLVTHCGRQLRLRTERGDVEIADVPLASVAAPCKQCWGLGR